MTIYKSKVDAWLVAIIAVAVIASLLSAVEAASAGSLRSWALATFITAVGVCLPLWLLVSTRYTLSHDELLVRSGPFNWHIPIAGITSVTPTFNPLASPALSLDRLRIEYGRGAAVMISPRDKARFISDLEAARRTTAGPSR